MDETCDCSNCRGPSPSYIGCGNPPHGWFRLARMRLATTEDSYLWCCVACHQLIYDRNAQGNWTYLTLHHCPAKEVELKN